MEIKLAADLARTLMTHYHLNDWQFKFDHSVRRLGRTSYTRKVISLSKPITVLNETEKVRNTILHEIAHAMVGPEHGHDATWEKVAHSLGCDGQRFSYNHVSVPHKYIFTCIRCGVRSYRHKKVRGSAYHSRCGVSGKLALSSNPEYKRVHV